MKAAVFYGKGDLRVEEAVTPVAGKGEILVRVRACGVCGTDVHIFSGDEGAAKTTPPVILGHEFSGEVEETGEGVTEFKKGDRVCVDPNVLCGECHYCKNALGHFCEHMQGIGTTVNGGFAEYVAVPAKQAYKLDDGTSFEEGAMTEPVACCLHGIDMCNIRPGDDVAVIGGGMIGLIMLQLARLKGAARVVLIEPVKEKREKALSLGAYMTVDPVKEDVAAAIERAKTKRLSCVIECVGLTSTIEQAIEIAGNAATVMMFGLTKPDAEIRVKPFTVFKKEIVLKSSFINPYTQGRALNLINSKALDVSSMVANVVLLEKLKEVLSDASMRAKGKFIVRP